MTIEHLWLLFLVFPPVLWTMFNSHRSRSREHVPLKAFGTFILLLALFLPGFFPGGSRAAATALADALAGLSGRELSTRIRVNPMPKRVGVN